MHFRHGPATLRRAGHGCQRDGPGARRGAPVRRRGRPHARGRGALPRRHTKGTRARAVRPFDDRDRVDWHYTPRSRSGAALRNGREGPRGRACPAARGAVGGGLPARHEHHRARTGAARDRGIRPHARPEKYHLTIYGTPDMAKAWAGASRASPVAQLHAGGRPGGGRLAQLLRRQSRGRGGRYPQGPARARRGGGRGPRPARLAREAQRGEAVFDSRTYGDIVTAARRRSRPLDAVGIPASRLDEKQRLQLVKLIEAHANAFEPGLAKARMERVREGGMANLRFGWRAQRKEAGPTITASRAAFPHRVRRFTGWRQSHPHRVARLQRRFRARPAARAPRTRPRHPPPALTYQVHVPGTKD